MALLARTRRDQAIEWLDKNPPKNNELRRYRVQAAELRQGAELPEAENIPMREQKWSPSKK